MFIMEVGLEVGGFRYDTRSTGGLEVLEVLEVD